MRKEKHVSVYSTFSKLYLHGDTLLDNISQELLLNNNKSHMLGETEVDFIRKTLLSSTVLRHYDKLNSIKENFIKKDVYGILTKEARNYFLFYKIGSSFFREVGNLHDLISDNLLYEKVNNNYVIFSLNSFDVLQAYDTHLSNTVLGKFFNIKYGIDYSKLRLGNVKRIYISKNSYENVLVVFDYKEYSNYYGCTIMTKNNVVSFPMLKLPKYKSNFSLSNYLLNMDNYAPSNVSPVAKYMLEDKYRFVDIVDDIIQNKINAEEFLMKLYI